MATDHKYAKRARRRSRGSERARRRAKKLRRLAAKSVALLATPIREETITWTNYPHSGMWSAAGSAWDTVGKKYTAVYHARSCLCPTCRKQPAP